MKQILAKTLSDMQRDRGISLTSELHNSPEPSQTNEEQLDASCPSLRTEVLQYISLPGRKITTIDTCSQL